PSFALNMMAGGSPKGAGMTDVLPGGGAPGSNGAVGTVQCWLLTSSPKSGGRCANGAPVTALGGITTEPRGAEPGAAGGITRVLFSSKQYVAGPTSYVPFRSSR